MADRSLADQLKDVLKGVKRQVIASIDAVARDYANEAADLIRERTRAGYGVARDGGQPSPLKRLSPRYIRFRQLNARRLSSQTTAGMSNLTFSGKLLDGLRARRKSRGVWQVVPSNDRTKIAQYVSRARPFLFLSSAEQAQLTRDAQRRFDALARRKGFS